MRPSTSTTALVLLALAADAFSAPNSQAKPRGTSMKLARRSTNRTTEEWGQWAKAHREHLISKYSANSDSKRRSKQRRGQGTNLIVNQNADSTYFGSLAVGTPPVAFDVILDTGSADLWIAGSSCTTSCSGITTFDSSSSSSFKNLSTAFSITYGSGEASGTLGEDTIQMAGFSVSNQTFAVVDKVSSGLLTEPVSGLLGLAWQTIASSGATPFWQALVEGGAWDDPIMAFQLTRYVDQAQAQAEEYGGSFTMGFANSSLYTGDIEYQSLVNNEGTYWLLEISDLTVQGSSVTLTSGTNSYAAIDTGTTLVGGPSDVIAEVYAQIPDSQAGTGDYDGYYIYPCDTEVSVSIAFGGSSWSISSADFELAQLSRSQCLGAFFELDMSGSSSPSWIVGDTFLKNVYSVFRYEPAAVGFANLSSTATAMNGDLDAEVPTPTLGSVAAAITATGSGNTRSSSDAMPNVQASLLGFGTLLAALFTGAFLIL